VRSLILGVCGQDGSLLAARLVAGGHDVLGVGRDEPSATRAAALPCRYHSLDLCDTRGVAELVQDFRPQRIYYLAGVHGAAGFHYEPVFAQTLAVNVGGLHPLLEYARQDPERVRLVYASSVKVFAPLAGVVSETSPKAMSCLYSTTKLAAEGLIGCYRKDFGVRANIVYYGNHESSLRGPDFLFSILASNIARCVEQPDHRFKLHTLNFWGDWGAADEYMELTTELVERAPGRDVLMATGITWWGRELVERLFARFGLEARHHIDEVQPKGAVSPRFTFDVRRLVECVGRSPRVDILDVAEQMVRTRLAAGGRPRTEGEGAGRQGL